LQAEGEGIVSNLNRPTNRAVDLDFQATDTSTGEVIFVDLKTPIDFKTVGPDRWRFPTYRKVGYDMGKRLTEQKLKHLGLTQGPKSANEVLHVINLDRIYCKCSLKGS